MLRHAHKGCRGPHLCIRVIHTNTRLSRASYTPLGPSNPNTSYSAAKFTVKQHRKGKRLSFVNFRSSPHVPRRPPDSRSVESMDSDERDSSLTRAWRKLARGDNWCGDKDVPMEGVKCNWITLSSQSRANARLILPMLWSRVD